MKEFKVGHYYKDKYGDIFKVLSKEAYINLDMKHSYRVKFLNSNYILRTFRLETDKKISKEEAILELL